MRSLALCDLVSHTSFVLAALRALHVDPSYAPGRNHQDEGNGHADNDVRMRQDGVTAAPEVTRERSMGIPPAAKRTCHARP
jgi:hypothetical protein